MFLQFATLLLVAFLCLYFGLYLGFVFTIWWWDILLHFFGGAWVVLFTAWAAHVLNIRLRPGDYVLALVIASVGWEILEYIGSFLSSPFMSYTLDTAKDLIFDMLGGAAAMLVVREERI